MSDPHLPAPIPDDDSEVRLELTNAEGRQVWALYSRPPQEPETAESPLSIFLREIPPIAWRWRRYVIGCVVAAVALGGVYLLSATSVYGVSALLLVEHRASNIQDYLLVQKGNDFLATQSEILHSPPIVRTAVVETRHGIAEDDESGLLQRLASFVGIERERVDPESAAVKRSLAALQATPVLGTQVIALTYRTPEPDAGIPFLQAVIDSYTGFVRGMEHDAHKDAMELLREREQELLGELRDLEQRYEEMHAGAQYLGGDSDVMSIQKARLEQHAKLMVEAQTSRIRLENEVRAMKGQATTARSSEMLADLRTAERELAELRSRYSDRHPEVRQAVHRVQALRAPLPQSSETQVAELERMLRAARNTERRLTALYESEFAKSKELDSHYIKERRVVEELENARESHQMALRMLREKELTVRALSSQRAGVVVSTLEPPTLLDEKLWPRTGPVLFACVMVGLMGGLGLAVLADRSREPEPEVYAAEVEEEANAA
jgi:uncharacterized protein involved in exopolysaccharide biosynthesis